MQRGNFHSQNRGLCQRYLFTKWELRCLGNERIAWSAQFQNSCFTLKWKEKEQMTIKQLKMQYWDQVYTSRSLKKIR